MPGWYPDPSGVAQARWWDGGQWTPAVTPHPQATGPSAPPAVAPPSWTTTSPPQTPTQSLRPAPPAPPAPPARVAPSDAPPGTVLFDEKIVGVGVHSRQLRITPEEISWGKETVALDRITGVGYWATKVTMEHVIPAGTERTFVFCTPGGRWKVPLKSHKLNPSFKHNDAHFERLIEISEHLIEPRLCRAALAVIETGGEYTVDNVTLDRSGIRSNARIGKKAIAWSALDACDWSGRMLAMTEAGSRLPINLSREAPNAVIVAKLVPVCARKFG